MSNQEQLIRTKERVRCLAEVYTAKREVKSMLDLVPQNIWNKIDSTFLEPSCGDGNFIEEILIRKLNTIKITKHFKKKQNHIEFDFLITISSIYGVDICPENIERCKNRVLNLVLDFYSNTLNTLKPTEKFIELLNFIINKNFICGDTINHPNKIFIYEWKRPVNFGFKPKIFSLNSLSEENPKPFKEEKIIFYMDL